jgi:hypothetical protein
LKNGSKKGGIKTTQKILLIMRMVKRNNLSKGDLGSKRKLESEMAQTLINEVAWEKDNIRENWQWWFIIQIINIKEQHQIHH